MRPAEKEQNQKRVDKKSNLRLTDFFLKAVLAGTLSTAAAVGAITPANASVYSGEPRSGAFTVENSNDGEEAAAGAGAGPLPVAESVTGQPPEATSTLTETQKITETLKFLPLSITTHVTGTIEANGKVVGSLTAGKSFTVTEGVVLDSLHKSLRIPLAGGNIAVLSYRDDFRSAATIRVVGGKPVEIAISQEQRPIGTATVTSDVLNVRTSESATAPILGQLKKDDLLTVLRVITTTNETPVTTDDAVRFEIVYENEDGSVSNGFVASKIGKDTFTTPYIANPIPQEGLGGTGGLVNQENTNWFTNFANWWNDVKTFFGWSDEEVTVVTAADGVTPIAIANKETGEVVATITPAATPGEFLVTPAVEVPKKSEYEIPSWFQGVETNLQVTNGEFVFSNEQEGYGFILRQVANILAAQKNMSLETFIASLQQSGGITTFKGVFKSVKNPTDLLISVPAIRPGEQELPLDLTKIYIDALTTTPTQSDTSASFETGQSAEKGVANMIGWLVDENNHLHIQLSAKMLNQIAPGLDQKATIMERPAMQSLVAKYARTADQVWSDMLKQIGADGPGLLSLKSLEVLALANQLPVGGEVWSADGDLALKNLLWGKNWNDISIPRQPQFPNTDEEKLWEPFNDEDMVGYPFAKDAIFTFVPAVK